MSQTARHLTSSHWGDYVVETRDGAVTAVHAPGYDTHPSLIGQSLMDSQHPGCRIPRPHVRAGYLRHQWRDEARGRGSEPFVAVPWDEALDLAASAIRHVSEEYGNASIFGGSYGWASAGRFHHAQSQLHRFLNFAGGYTSHRHSYSTGTAQVIVPHVLGIPALDLMTQAPTMTDVARNARLVVSFGGMSMKNMQINQGGIGDHRARAELEGLRDAGVDVVCISPVRNDVAGFLEADWWPVRPNSDVALMLGLAHVLYTEDLHDRAFLESHCVGFERFVPYLTGASDGVPKTPEWASALCDIEPERIRSLARRMAAEPCLVSISWSLQRTENGDQPYWMVTMLGAMLGEIGLRGRGLGFGYGCLHNFGFAGRRRRPFKVGELPQGTNPVRTFIPVARIADLLLNPGTEYPFDGQTLTYPEIQLVYWAGGNPFHHHQDLNRLREAWRRPGTVIVNEPAWTATARHADIVFPTTGSLEREDFAWGTSELHASPMHRALEPYAESRDDYAIFGGLAERLGFAEQFTEGRSPRQWIEHLWNVTRQRAAEAGVALAEFEPFWNGETPALDPMSIPETPFSLESFRMDPAANPLNTPSGRIELFSERIAGFGLHDCLGHPAWFDKEEFIGSERSRRFPLALTSNQPATKLHSQLDFGRASTRAKMHGRERLQIHPQDAAQRGIEHGSLVRLFNDRGACLAAAHLNDGVRQGVVVLPTGAWYSPSRPEERDSLEVHGNPNVLTRDIGTSTLAQGTSAHSTLVEVELHDGEAPPVQAFQQPPTVPREDLA